MEKIKTSTKWDTVIINGEWISNGHVALRKKAFRRALAKFENYPDGRYTRQGATFAKVTDKAPNIESFVPQNLERFQKVEIDDSLLLSDCRTKIIGGHVGNGRVRISIDYLPFLNGWKLFAADETDPVVFKDSADEIVGVVMPMRKK